MRSPNGAGSVTDQVRSAGGHGISVGRDMKDRALAAIAVVLGAFTAAESDAATIFVSHDEWTLSDKGFANAPAGAAAFVNNLVAEMGPKIHAYSTNLGFTGSALATAMTSAGATFTTGTFGFDFISKETYLQIS